MSNALPRGLIGVLITPFDKDGNIDAEGLKSVINFTLNYVNGFLGGVSYTGEGFLLSPEKKIELLRITLETVAGKIPLILGITGETAEETKKNIAFVEKTRDALNYSGEISFFHYPLWYRSNRGLPGYYQELSKLTELPFILYNNPVLFNQHKGQLRRKNLRTNVLKKLSENEQIVGIKHSGDAKRGLNYLKALRRRKDFVYYDGNELNFLSSPGPGGVISQGVNILPRDWKEIVSSSLNPYDSRKEDPVYCQDLWDTGEKLKVFHRAYIANPPAVLKKILKHMGIISGSQVARGTPLLTKKEEQEIDALLKKYHFKS